MRRRRIVCISLVAAVAALIGAFALFDEEQTIPLSDGWSLTFRAVEVGTNCSDFYGNWAERIGEKLPLALQSSLFKHAPSRLRYGYSPSVTSLVVWMELVVPEPVRFNDNSGLQFTIGDSEGGTFIPLPGLPTLHRFEDGKCAAIAVAARWPHRAKRLILRVWDPNRTNDSKWAGEFRLSNPAYRAYPVWNSEPLPVSVRLEDTVVTLEKFHTHPFRTHQGPVFARRSSPVVDLRAVSRLRATPLPGSNAAPWILIDARLVDATGGHSAWQAPGPPSSNGLFFVSLPVPWPDEKVFRLESHWGQVGYIPTLISPIGHQIDLETAAINPDRAAAGWMPSGHYEIRLRRDMGNVVFPMWELTCVNIRDPDKAEYAILVSATDEKGRRWDRSPGVGNSICVSDDVKRVTVTVETHRLRTLTFTVSSDNGTNDLRRP